MSYTSADCSRSRISGKRINALKFASLSAFVLLAAFWLVPQVIPEAKELNATPQNCLTCPEPTQQTIYAPTVGLPEVAGGQIVLNSRSPQVKEVTPIFYTADGTAIVGASVQLQPAEIRFVEIDELIPEDHRGRHLWGGMSLSYTGKVLEVWAQLTLRGIAGAGSIDVTFSVLDGRGADVQEAVWWMPERGVAIIALGNSSDVSIRTGVQHSNGETEIVEIPAHATVYVRRRARGNRSAAGSIKLTTTGPAGSLRAVGFIIAPDRKFTGSIRFYAPRDAVQSHLFATNLRLRNAAPRMVLKNTSDAEVSAQPRFRPPKGEAGDPLELPSLTLQPQEAVEVDLRSLTRDAARRADMKSVSVEIVNSGSPGSLIGALYSSDARTGTNYDVPLRDSGRNRNLSGSYPWRVDDDYTTVVTVTNVGDEAAKFHVDIRHTGGSYFLAPRELSAGETATFDLRQMQSGKAKDNKGKVLPQDITSGQFHWSVSSSPGTPKLIGRAEVVSVAERVSSSYSCPTCCPDSGPDGRIEEVTVEVIIDGFAQVGTAGWMTDCYGNQTDMGGTSMWWRVADSSKAAVNPTVGSVANVQGLDVGETRLIGEWYFDRWDAGPEDCQRSTFVEEDMAEMEIRPTITSITPARGLVGNSVSVTINGNGFRSGATVQAGAGINASVNSASRTQITATFNIDANATGGNHAVTVKVGNQTSNSTNFFVQIPSRLEPITLPGAPNGVGPLQTPVNQNVIDLSGRIQAENVCGVYRNYAYVLVDQEGQRITQAYTISENFGNYSGFDPPGPQTQTFNIPANGELTDVHFVGLRGRCLGPLQNERFTQSFVVSIGGINRGLLTIYAFSLGNFNGTLRVDRSVLQ